MLRTIRNAFGTVPTVRKMLRPQNNQVRTFWEYVNMKFNTVDTDRLKEFGPDRVCAEWVLRNGGKVVWADGKKLADYNFLPSEKTPVKKVIEIDGTDSSISHYGFPHLIGCTALQRVILHNNNYIDDRALQGLSYAGPTLTQVQVSKCVNVTDEGVKSLKQLSKLEILTLFDLISVADLEGCKQYLRQNLPDCKIEDKANETNITQQIT